jgi:alpha-mannosidase
VKLQIQRLIAIGLLLGSTSLAAEKAVWRIGSFNHSSGEFKSQNIDYSDSRQDPIYRVGLSTDAEDWQRFQPGPANGMAGGREHPFTILFSLPEKPKGVFRLKIAMMYETPRLSHLRVSVNGHSGLIYFHPKLDYSAGDWEGTFVPHSSSDTKTIDLSAEWFKHGENRIVLTALDEPAIVENSLGSIATGHTGIVYDALELTHDAAENYATSRIDAQVIPTIFYRKLNGRIYEVIDVFANFGSLPKSGTAELTIGGKTYRQAFSATEQFGEHRIVFEVPEWKGTTQGALKIGSKHIPIQLTAAKKWTLYVVPHEHLDIGFTDYPARVAELHSESTDQAIDIMQRVPEFRWTLDGSFVAQQYMLGRSSQEQEKFLQYVRDGKVVIPPEFANQHTGTASLEGLVRSLYFSHEFAKKYNVPIGAAQIVDVPSYSWSYASVLNGAGLKQFAAASNSWRAPVQLIGRWNEKSPFYWEGPDGSRVFMWYSRAYLQMHTMFGSPARVAAVRDALPVFLQAYTRPDYVADAAIIFGSQLENTPLGPEQAELPREWAKTFAWPKLEFTDFRTALSSLEKQMPNRPVYRGDFGPYWEDGFGSDAAATAVHRRNEQRIATAEVMSTVTSVLNPNVHADLDRLDKAWNNILLFDEHTWTYVGGTTQPEHEQTQTQTALKRARATEADREITETIHRTWGQLATVLSPKENSLVVFNSQAWPKTGMIETDLQDGTEIYDPGANAAVPYEVEYVGKGTPLPGFGGGYRRIRFLARDVPALGYKMYRYRPGKVADVTPSDTSSHVLENEFYRITLDSDAGAIKSIVDKQLGKELVDQASPYRFGSYLYVTGGDDIPNNRLYRYGAALKPPVLTVHTASNGQITAIKKAPFGTVVEMESSATNTPRIRTELILYNAEKKIEFTYHLNKAPVLTKEAAYIAFPFAVLNPAFRYDTQTAWVNPAKDTLRGGSLEWFAATRWTSVDGPDLSAAVIPVDAPLVAFGDIVRGSWPTEFKPKSGTIFSWLLNNYWNTNFLPEQGGEMKFRYVITSAAKLNPAELTRQGAKEITPLEVGQAGPARAQGPMPPTTASLLEFSDPNVGVVTWKLAEDGQGTILRLQELAGEARTVRIESKYFTMRGAWRCNLLEDNQVTLPLKNGGLDLQLKPFEIVTVRLKTEPNTVLTRAAGQ